MGMGMYIALERETEGIDPVASICGKAALRAQEDLERLADTLKLRRTDSMISFSTEELEDDLENFGVDRAVERNELGPGEVEMGPRRGATSGHTSHPRWRGRGSTPPT
jgi:hypothetical protein